MHVYIPYNPEMIDTLTRESEKLFVELCAGRKEEGQTAWVKFRVPNQSWTYFEIAKADPTLYTQHVGTYEDFMNMLFITDDAARFEYAKANCKLVWIKGGVVVNEDS